MTGGPPNPPGRLGAIAPNRRPGRVGPVAVIEGFAGRRSVIPFAILVLGLLSLGLVILLLLNTAMDRGAFELSAAQKRQSQLTDQQQELQLRLAALSAPGALASQASALGMVPNPRPVFLNPNSGAVLGVPTAAPTTAAPKPSPSASPSLSASASASASATPSTPASATPSTSASGTRP
jgi:type II secretory pathway pseudopilin PulG